LTRGRRMKCRNRSGMPVPCRKGRVTIVRYQKDGSATTFTPHDNLSDTSTIQAGGGPGTELKKLLSRIGIRALGNCQCNARAAEMDRGGADWCRENLETIVGWLK